MGRHIRLVVLGLVIIIGAGVYTWQSLGYWREFESGLARQREALLTLRDDALGADTMERRVTALRSLDDRIQKRDEFCRASPIFGWQAIVVPVLRDGLKRCQAEVAGLARLAGPLHDLRSYVDFTARLQTTISRLKTPQPLQPKNWKSDGLANAQRVAADLKKIPAAGDAAKLKSQAVMLAARTEEGWKQLIAANEAKKLTDFVTASTALTSAYADFMALADSAESAVQAKVATVREVTNQL